LAFAAAAYWFNQQQASTLMIGLLLAGLALLLALLALILGFVELVSRGRSGWVAGVFGMGGGALILLAVIVLTVSGSLRLMQQKFELTEGGELQLPEVAPLVINKKAKSVDDNYHLWIRWFDENLFPPMRSRLAGKPWEKVGEQVLDAFVSDWLGKWDRRTEKEWQYLAGELSRLGCDEPMLLYMVARTCDIGEQQFEVLTWSNHKLGESDFNPIWAFITQIEKNKRLDYHEKKKAKVVKKLDAEALRRLEKACLAGCFEGENLWLLHQLLRTMSGIEFCERSGDKIAEVFERTGMPEWTVLWMHGIKEIELAWDSRGGSYANKVTEQGWKGFSEHLALAREHLTKSWELAPEFPFAAAAMIKVTMGSSEDKLKELRLWLDRSLHAQMDYTQALQAYEWALYPRWAGSHEMMLQFGDYCLESGDYKTGLPMFYREVIKDLAKESGDRGAYYKQEWVYESLTRMHEGQAKACVDDAGRRFNWTELAVLAYRAEDYEKLREYWQRLQGEYWERTVLAYSWLDREDFVFCAAVNQFDERIQAARVFGERGLYGAAVDEYQIYLSQETLSEEKQQLLRKRIALLKLKEKWEAGQWVTLWPTENPDLWRAVEGSWQEGADGSLIAKSEGFRYAFEHALRVGENYEVEASIGPAKNSPLYGGYGIWVSKWAWYGTHWDAAVFCIEKAKKDEFYVAARRWRYRSNWAKTIERKEPQVLNLKCHGKFWQISVNGKKMNDKEIKMDGHHNGEQARLALGGHVDPDKQTTVEYRRVRVRKLQARTAAAKAAAVKMDAKEHD